MAARITLVCLSQIKAVSVTPYPMDCFPPITPKREWEDWQNFGHEIFLLQILRHCYLCWQANRVFCLVCCSLQVKSGNTWPEVLQGSISNMIVQVPGNVLENRIPFKLPHVPATQTCAGTALSTTLWPA